MRSDDELLREAVDAALADGPTDAEVGALERALSGHFDGGGGGGPPGTSASAWGWALVAAVGLGLLAGWGWLASRPSPSPMADTIEQEPARSPLPTAPPASLEVAEPPGHEPAVAVQARTRGRPRRRTVSESERGPIRAATANRQTVSIPSELALIRQARGLAGTEPARALRVLGEHREHYPTGVLSQEREVIRIRALLASGRRTDAKATAARYLEAHPETPHRRRVEALLSGHP